MRALLAIPLGVVLVGCADELQLPSVSFDNVPAFATITSSGLRDRVQIWIDPEHATLAGALVDRLSFRLDLSDVADCADECAMPLDGIAVTGAFILGALAYDIGPTTDPETEPCPLVRQGDPLAIERGAIAGTFTFRRLDRDGARLGIVLFLRFGADLAVQDVVHTVAVGDFEVAFERY